MKRKTISAARSFAMLLFGVVLLLSGCGFKYMYNQLDRMIPGFVSGFVTLDEVQQADVEQRAVQLLRWHRQQQLPEYVQWLESFKQDVAQGLQLQQVRLHMQTLEGFWKGLLVEIADDLAEITVSLNEEQRRELFDKVGEDNSDYSAEYVKVEKQVQIDVYKQRLEDNFSRWLGDLSKSQREMMQKTAQAFKPTWDDRLQARHAWQGHVKKILNSKVDRATKVSQLKQMVMQPEKYRHTALSDKMAYNREVFTGLVVEIAASLSKSQRKHLNEKIEDFKSTFIDLIKEGQKKS